ncbi:hypothetical protein GOZ96_04810 [Agrobacterium vitis]|nr:hypothetical protein [Agrobacterium vitis]MUZ95910.1 hypothetical protein [Agrobacterium vitis]
MLGMTIKIGLTIGKVDAEVGQPDGTLLVRINDQWFPASMACPPEA